MNKSLPIVLPNDVYHFSLVVIGFVSFVIPFLLAGPQILVGSLVNASLILSVLFLPKNYSKAVLFLPSLGILSRGIVFGPLTSFLIIFLPFIWFSNYILVTLFKRSLEEGKSFFVSLTKGALIKSLFLFTMALSLFGLGLVPKLFLGAMSYFQLLTALLGGSLAYFIKKYYD
ncbi:hypothetical protein COT75_01420 [Candidatus Beckwithbacteria bacterium CG10_big_fil_rev_8_21_14_0_10_34_10]|uniref:Iron hydrogenase n=1 Tax=Candidatus Beckwithbacteria bacterium CG10_big_fil_rev_8_21_14_0_10_34_10 TaxID=1974495 RepID=A0A2H0W9U4_9BACT|nr:MAG: hypothetical protein COT75_01420 [Candidatus Beckwithbacteria bacterium CG10_big_fil_rev_8_21_14_0_10_34_10]